MNNQTMNTLADTTSHSNVALTLRTACLMLSTLTAITASAATNIIGGADGTFETDLTGFVVTGDVNQVPNLGIVQPTEGAQALLLTTEPDAGSAPGDATVSTLLIENFTIDAAYATLRVNYNYLTDEPGPSYANDTFEVRLILVTAGGEEQLLASDTFDQFTDAPWTGYDKQTGFRSMVADVLPHAGTGDQLTLSMQITDVGDGRRNSAVLLDDLRLVEPGVPEASVQAYYAINPGDTILFDATNSTDDVSISTYDWDFGNGFIGFGPNVAMDQYTMEGIFQGTLTVTDGDGNTDTAHFTVVAGDPNTAPIITSVPVTAATENIPYQYQVTVADAEAQFGDTATFALTTAPTGMTIDAGTGLIGWTPDATADKRSDVTVEVTDSMGLTDTQSFAVAIGPEYYVATISDDSRLYTARSLGGGAWDPLQFIEDLGNLSRGIAIADFNADDDFDIVTGYGANPTMHLFYYEREGSGFETPVYLGPVGMSGTSAGTYPEDMAAEDFNNDGNIDLIVNGDSAFTWYLENTGALVTEPENFFASDFETGTEGWGGQQTRTAFERVDTTASSGTWSTRVYATGTPTSLSIDINPSNWFLSRGSTVRFDYRIPPGVPAGMLFQVSGFGWVWLGGAPAGDRGTFPEVPNPVALIDDDTWRTVEFDLYQLIRELWPTASQVTEFEWWTNNNGAAGDEFWFDDFRITRPRMTSGFDITLLPSAGGNSRGTDAADANGDGNMDFARGRTSSGYIYLYTGDGTGNLTPSATQVADPGSDPYGVLLKDFDNDGIPDLIGNSSSSGNPSFFKGNGDGTFQGGVYVASLDTNNFTSLSALDFDGDGNIDVVAATYTSRQLWYYPGNGDGTFGTRTLIGSTTSPAANILAVAAPAGRALGQPFANATQDQTSINEGELVNFDATGSYDNGSIVSYEWDFGDGNTATGPTVSYDFPTEGDFTVVLTVTDDDGLTDRFGLNVVVFGDAPIAVPGNYAKNENDALLGRWEVDLDGSASTDSDTTLVNYQWDVDDSDGVGVDLTGAMPVAVYTAPGVYTITLTVTDEVGLTGTATGTVTITAGGVPVAAFAGPTTLDETNASLTDWTGWYSAAGSTDAEGISTYSVDWDDGTPPSVLAPLADNFEDGNFTANPTWNAFGGTWSVIGGEVAQTNLGSAWRFLQDLNRSYVDFEVELDFMGVDTGTNDGYMGIVFRNANTAGSTNSLLMYSRNSWDFWRFYDWRTGTTLQDGGTGWDEGIWYHLRMRVVGDTMELYVTPEGGVEALQIQTTRAGFPSGGIGILANAQNLRYDNIKITPLDENWSVSGETLADFVHSFDTLGSFDATLTVTDHAGQSGTETITTTTEQGAPPVVDAGGPYVLGETDAYDGRWDFVASGSATDDTNVERYTIDFGDGTSYTTSTADGSRASYFAVGTDLYGYDTAGANLQRIVVTEDATDIEIINLANNAVIASTTLNRYQTWNNVTPGDGVFYKVKATKPVLAYFTDLANHSAFVPSLDGTPVGSEFIFYYDVNQGFYVYAVEDSLVTFYNTSDAVVRTLTVRAGEYRSVAGLSGAVHRVVATGRVAMQTTGANGYTTVPSSNGDGVGDLFYFATQTGTTGAFAVFAHAAADVEVFDMDSGTSLYTRSMAGPARATTRTASAHGGCVWKARPTWRSGPVIPRAAVRS